MPHKRHPADNFMWGVVTALVGVPSGAVTLWLLLGLIAVQIDQRRPVPEDPKGSVVLLIGMLALLFVAPIYLSSTIGAVRAWRREPAKVEGMKPHKADRFMWCVLTAIVGLPALAVSLACLVFLGNVAWGFATNPGYEADGPVALIMLAFMACLCAGSGFVFLGIAGVTLRAFRRAKQIEE
jgi:hypothetical protein